MSFEALSPSRLPSQYTYSIKYLAIHLTVKTMLSFTYFSSFLMFQFLIVWYLFPRGELLLRGLQESYVRNCVCVALQQHRAQHCQPVNLVCMQEGACYRRQVLSPSSFGSQLPPLFSLLVCEFVLDMRLEQSPPAVPDPSGSSQGWVLCTH